MESKGKGKEEAAPYEDEGEAAREGRNGVQSQATGATRNDDAAGEELDEDSESFLDMWFEGIEPDYISALPDKLLLRCIGYLTDIIDICSLERVCKKTSRLIRNDKTLWEFFLRTHYYQEWMKMKQGELLYGSHNALNPALSLSQKRKRDAIRRKSTDPLSTTFDDNDTNKWRSSYVREAERLLMWRKQRYSYHLLYKGGLLDVDQGFMLSVAKDADDVVELWDALKDRHLTALTEVDVEELRYQSDILQLLSSNDYEPQHVSSIIESVKKRRVVPNVQHHGSVEAIKIHQDWGICGYADGAILVFNLKSRALSGAFDGHKGAITSIEAIGNIVISSADLKPTMDAPKQLEIKLWNILDGCLLTVIDSSLMSPSPLDKIKFLSVCCGVMQDNASMRHLFHTTTSSSSSSSRTLRLHLISSWGKDIRSDLIDIVDAGGHLSLKEEKNEEESDSKVEKNTSKVLQGHSKNIVDLKVCHSKGLAASVAEEEEVLLWNLPTNDLFGRMTTRSKGGLKSVLITKDEEGKSMGVALSVEMDEKRVVVGTKSGAILLFDVDSCALIYSVRRDAAGICRMLLRGSTLFSGSESGSLRLWNLKFGRIMYTLYHPDTLTSGGDPSPLFAIQVIKVSGERVYATNGIDLMQWNFSARENALKFLHERKKPRLAFISE
eukprot:TRINITY_DN6017_c0_g1_i1.p1 TRINITY_DN6017_c0_g1~~TRINITY_DN6017_c0_g1_i1.p1  ORF type:complete len:666 (+),score=160.67 TRINITY_DN6017_c0_g1_i1:137-2134(+)